MIQSKFSKQPIFEYNFHPKFVVKVYQKCNLCCNLHKILNSTTNNNLHGAITGGISTSMYSVYSSLFFLHFILKHRKSSAFRGKIMSSFKTLRGHLVFIKIIGNTIGSTVDLFPHMAVNLICQIRWLISYARSDG